MSFLFGLILSGLVIALIAFHGGNPSLLFDFKAVLFVLGGTLGALFITFPFAAFREEMGMIAKLLKPAGKPVKLVEQISKLSQTARRGGVLALEGSEKTVKDPILKKGLLLISSSADQTSIRGILEKDSEFIGRKEKSAQEFFERLSMFAMGIGMAGTLLEIVQMLYTYTGPQKLAFGIARSLLPVVYGAIISYLVFLPLASRVRVGAEKQRVVRELSIEGVLAIHAGEPSQIVEERLSVFISGRKKAN